MYSFLTCDNTCFLMSNFKRVLFYSEISLYHFPLLFNISTYILKVGSNQAI